MQSTTVRTPRGSSRSLRAPHFLGQYVDDQRPAIVDRHGRSVSYADLATRAEDFARELGDERRLVFLEAAKTVDAIAAYVACRDGRHPVFLYGSQDRERIAPLIDLYGPNATIKTAGEASEIEWLTRDAITLQTDLAVLLSTSGSTASPKLVKLSRANLDSNAQAIASYLGLDVSERAMLALNFNYSYGLSIINSHLVSGGSLVLTEQSVTEPAFWEQFRSNRATSFAGVPFTFEALWHAGFAFDDLDTLRYATQAGGRLDPSLVVHFARLSANQGWRFVVMYGQTEASPRIAYLPHDQAEKYPDCIGIAVPGGHIALIDDDGREVIAVDTPGQLAYSGPNVMLGYAESREELATDETPRTLLTGDIACRNDAGLFRIVGRASRFVKPFGLRVNLDELEMSLQGVLPGARCAALDEQIVIATEADHLETGLQAMRDLAAQTGLPEFVFKVIRVQDMPRLDSGKVDYHGIRAAAEGRRERPATRPSALGALELVFSRDFARMYVDQVSDLLGLRKRTWGSIREIFEVLLDAEDVHDRDTFKSLAGDSMSYVQVTMALTEYLGSLPADWPDRPVGQLERIRLATHAPAL